MAGTDDWKAPLAGVVSRLPRYTKLGWALARAPQIPRKHKRVLLGSVLYTLSPIDLVPGIIPILGQLDDLGLLLWSIRRTLHHCPLELRDRLLLENQLTMQQLDTDLAALALVARNLARSVTRGVWKGSKWLGSKAGRGLAAGASRIEGRIRSSRS